jgi:nucleoside-diphosphate-sugar epimerase
MRIFLAGASGVIGRPLVPMLVDAGHEVVGTTRSPEKAERLRAAGAEPALVDALDAEALGAVVRESRPEVVIHELTDLPARFNPRKPDYGKTPQLRREATATLAAAGAEAGARRLISQSIAFIYRPSGGPVKDEDAPLADMTGSSFADATEATIELERITTETPALEGVVLRYGWFYGPGTYYGADGSTAEEVRKRRFPIVGDGGGVFSFIHVDDAASATVAALDQGEGVYNVCDDEPTPLREWLPVYAEALGAKPPRRVPAWIARLVAGKVVAGQATGLRGATNEKAKRELGWSPRYPSWRQGFAESLAAGSVAP